MRNPKDIEVAIDALKKLEAKIKLNNPEEVYALSQIKIQIEDLMLYSKKYT